MVDRVDGTSARVLRLGRNDGTRLGGLTLQAPKRQLHQAGLEGKILKGSY